MKGIFNANKRKYLVIALTVLLVGVVSVGTASLTFSKYTDSSYKRTVSAVIPGKQATEGGNPAPQPQEDPHIVTETPNTVYQVQSGDTLSIIAEKFNITIEALTAYNNIENTDNIQAGAILRIPPKDYVPPVSSEPSEETDNTEKTENSAAEAEPSAAMTGLDTSTEVRSENETIVENSDETSQTDTASTSETTETSEEISTAVSADEEHISDSNSDF